MNNNSIDNAVDHSIAVHKSMRFTLAGDSLRIFLQKFLQFNKHDSGWAGACYH